METKDDMHAFIHSPIIRDILFASVADPPARSTGRTHTTIVARGVAFPQWRCRNRQCSDWHLVPDMWFGPNISAGCVVMTSLIIK